MIVAVQVTQRVLAKTRINIPNGLSEDAVKQQIFDLYNSGQLASVMNNFHVVFEEINAQILTAEPTA